MLLPISAFSKCLDFSRIPKSPQSADPSVVVAYSYIFMLLKEKVCCVVSGVFDACIVMGKEEKGESSVSDREQYFGQIV